MVVSGLIDEARGDSMTTPIRKAQFQDIIILHHVL
jgi:hypothetical protein